MRFTKDLLYFTDSEAVSSYHLNLTANGSIQMVGDNWSSHGLKV